MSDEEGLRAIRCRRRKWYRDRIAKFAERERTAREWIALIELVDWCAQSTTASLDAESQAREVAYHRIADSLRRGEFEHGSRSKVLYLDANMIGGGWSPRFRLTREQFEIAFEGLAAPWGASPPIEVLNYCWLRRDLAWRWLELHGYRWPPHFEPVAQKPDSGEDTTRPDVNTRAGTLADAAQAEPASTQPAAAQAVPRKRGPKPVKLEAVEKAMRDAITEGRYTRKSLPHTKDDVLAVEFGASRSTARKARIKICSNF